MHRTQIYFEEELFNKIKSQANKMGTSISAYIREVLKKDLEKKEKLSQKIDFDEFAGMWSNRKDISIDKIRKKAWK